MADANDDESDGGAESGEVWDGGNENEGESSGLWRMSGGGAPRMDQIQISAEWESAAGAIDSEVFCLSGTHSLWY